MATTGTTRTRPRGSLPAKRSSKKPWPCSNEHGPGALSMRRLADRLGVAPNALYTHVRGKADLIDGLIDQVYAGLTLDPDPTGDWTQQLATLSQHPRPPARPPRRRPLRPPTARPRPPQPAPGRSHLQVLRPAGFSDQAAVGVVYALLTYILGFVALEIPRAGPDPQTSDEYVRRLPAFFAALPPGEFPHTVQLAPRLARSSTGDQFQFGIRIFLAGLQAQQPTPEHST